MTEADENGQNPDAETEQQQQQSESQPDTGSGDPGGETQPEQAPEPVDGGTEDGSGADQDAAPQATQSNDDARDVQVIRSSDDNDLPPGTKEIRIARKDGSAYDGQLVPDEESEEQKLLAKRREDVHNAYFGSRSECPVCHVSDGVRQGNNHCDSCGARWQPRQTADA